MGWRSWSDGKVPCIRCRGNALRDNHLKGYWPAATGDATGLELQHRATSGSQRTPGRHPPSWCRPEWQPGPAVGAVQAGISPRAGPLHGQIGSRQVRRGEVRSSLRSAFPQVRPCAGLLIATQVCTKQVRAGERIRGSSSSADRFAHTSGRGQWPIHRVPGDTLAWPAPACRSIRMTWARLPPISLAQASAPSRKLPVWCYSQGMGQSGADATPTVLPPLSVRPG